MIARPVEKWKAQRLHMYVIIWEKTCIDVQIWGAQAVGGVSGGLVSSVLGAAVGCAAKVYARAALVDSWAAVAAAAFFAFLLGVGAGAKSGVEVMHAMQQDALSSKVRECRGLGVHRVLCVF